MAIFLGGYFLSGHSVHQCARAGSCEATSSNKSSQVNAVDAVHGGVQWTLVVWMCAGDAKGSDVAVTLLNT
jgi:hypothetical protein